MRRFDFLYFFLKIVLYNVGSLYFNKNFRASLSTSDKKAATILNLELTHSMHISRFHCGISITKYVVLIIFTILLNSFFVLIISWYFAWEFLHSLGIIDTSTILSLLIHEHEMFSHLFLLKVISYNFLRFFSGPTLYFFCLIYLYFSILMILTYLFFSFSHYSFQSIQMQLDFRCQSFILWPGWAHLIIYNSLLWISKRSPCSTMICVIRDNFLLSL